VTASSTALSSEVAPSAPPGGAGAHKRLDVQGLRGVAVLMVVAYHSHLPIPGGFTGVDVFFVISGYVITSLIRRELVQTGRLALRRFYLRRAFRLLPALALTSFVTAIGGMLLLSPLGTQQQSAATGGAASLWTSNVALYAITSSYFSVQVEDNPFLHTWSLGVEEQFYLVFPFILLGGWVLGHRLRKPNNVTLIIGIVLVTLLSFALSLATSFGWVNAWVPKSSIFAFYLSPARAWEFGIGALIACSAGFLSRPLGGLRSVATWVGLALILTAALTVSGADAFPGWVGLLPVAGTALAIAGGVAGPVGACRLLSSRPLVVIGDISYSWYLWHWPFIVFSLRLWPGSRLAIFGAVALSLVAATVSYRFVEQRFRTANPRANWRSVRFLTAAILAPALACFALLLGATRSWGSASVSDASRQLLARPIGYSTCLNDNPISTRDISTCTWGADRSGSPIYLIGDSNAQHLTEALIGAAKMEGRPLTVATMGGCALADVRVRTKANPAQEQACANFVADGLMWLGNQRPGIVVLAAAGESIEDPDVAYRASGDQWASTPDE
jgi:peptidoglycan/LPS O-acetylase OafA/YrhL